MLCFDYPKRSGGGDDAMVAGKSYDNARIPPKILFFASRTTRAPIHINFS